MLQQERSFHDASLRLRSGQALRSASVGMTASFSVCECPAESSHATARARTEVAKGARSIPWCSRCTDRCRMCARPTWRCDQRCRVPSITHLRISQSANGDSILVARRSFSVLPAIFLRIACDAGNTEMSAAPVAIDWIVDFIMKVSHGEFMPRLSQLHITMIKRDPAMELPAVAVTALPDESCIVFRRGL